MKPLAIDLFSGAGGFSEGILQAGFHIIYSSDINESVEKTYMNRHEQLGLFQGENTFFRRGDIKDIDSEQIIEDIKSLDIYDEIKGKDIDAIFGGPPCQGFSRAGRRAKDDPRNMLFKEYIRVINDLEPRYVVMENVTGFMDTRLDDFIGIKGKNYGQNKLISEILLEEFELIGYGTLIPQILDASDFGVPQRRRRAIFIAYKDGEKVPTYPTPFETSKVTINEAISDLTELSHYKSNSKYQEDSKNGRTPDIRGNLIKSKQVKNNDKSAHSLAVIERFSIFKNGENGKHLFERIKKEGIDIREYPHLLKEIEYKVDNDGKLDNLIKCFKTGNIDEDMFKIVFTKKMNRYRFDSDTIAPTVVTMPDDYISAYEDRVPTVREMARLQSFDDSFEFLGKRTTGGLRRRVEVPQYSQVGNAVPPLLAKAIASEIKKYL